MGSPFSKQQEVNHGTAVFKKERMFKYIFIFFNVKLLKKVRKYILILQIVLLKNIST